MFPCSPTRGKGCGDEAPKIAGIVVRIDFIICPRWEDPASLSGSIPDHGNVWLSGIDKPVQRRYFLNLKTRIIRAISLASVVTMMFFISSMISVTESEPVEAAALPKDNHPIAGASQAIYDNINKIIDEVEIEDNGIANTSAAEPEEMKKEPKEEKPKFPTENMRLIEASAYCDNGTSASGRQLRPGHSVAGMVSWLGRKAKIYTKDGKLMGTYSFDDTGYGKSAGYGESKILSGRCVGTIENGTCIDLYMATEGECMKWGRQNVYMEFTD